MHNIRKIRSNYVEIPKANAIGIDTAKIESRLSSWARLNTTSGIFDAVEEMERERVAGRGTVEMVDWDAFTRATRGVSPLQTAREVLMDREAQRVLIDRLRTERVDIPERRQIGTYRDATLRLANSSAIFGGSMEELAQQVNTAFSHFVDELENARTLRIPMPPPPVLPERVPPRGVSVEAQIQGILGALDRSESSPFSGPRWVQPQAQAEEERGDGTP